jgi:hypothetical protein
MRSTAELATGRLADLIEELGVLGEWPVNPYIMGPSRHISWYGALNYTHIRARRERLRQELQALEGAESVEQHG